MKKIGLLLLVCFMAVFSACDDKDKEKDPVPVNPVTEYKVPETGGIGRDVTVVGKGFPKESKIFLKGADAALKEVTVKTVTAVDLVFTVPADVKAGEYTVVLKIKDAEYELGKIKLEPAVPVTGVEVPKEAHVGEVVLIGGSGFAEDCKISLKPTTGSTIEIPGKDIEHVEKGIRFTLPELTLDASYSVILIQKGEWELGIFTVKGAIPRVQTVHCKMGYTEGGKEEVEANYTYKFTYDKEGRIETYVKEDMMTGGYTKCVAKYKASEIEVTYQDKDEKVLPNRSDIYHLNEEGVVTSSESQTEDGTKNYTYQYNTGFLTRIEPKINFQYESENLKVAWLDGETEESGGGYFSFTYGSTKYDALNLDPFAFILDDYFGFSDQNIRLLGIGGKKSAHLPTTAYGQYSNYEMGYTFTENEPKMITFINMLDEEAGSFMKFELKY